MRRTWSSVLVLLVPVAVLATGCSDDGAVTASTTASTTGGPTADLSAECETGSWVSTGMTFPAQAGIESITPTGGGDGMIIELGSDGSFQIDFGPMSPSTATFESGGQQGIMSATFNGVGEGIWTVSTDGVGMASFENFATAKSVVTLALGETVPPIFDNTLEQINEERMLGGEQVGVFTFTECTPDTLSMTTPFPGGEVGITAVRA